MARDDVPVHIAVPKLRRIANFDDLDPLAGEDDVHVTCGCRGCRCPLMPISSFSPDRNPHFPTCLSCVIRDGISTLLRTFAVAVWSWGLCGGYQMLGKAVDDPDGIEGAAGRVDGLGHLDVETILAGDKTLTRVEAQSVKFGRACFGL